MDSPNQENQIFLDFFSLRIEQQLGIEICKNLKRKDNGSKIIKRTSIILTINEPVDYMAQAVMILMRGKDITWAIGRVGHESQDFFWPETAQKSLDFHGPTLPMAQVMSLPRIKIISSKRHIKKGSLVILCK